MKVKRRHLKIIVINIVLVFLVLELGTLFWLRHRYRGVLSDHHVTGFYNRGREFDRQYADGINFRPISVPVVASGSKKPIVLFGCSQTWGENIGYEDTIGRKLSDLDKRTVYNRAYTGWGIQHMIFQLESEPLLDEIPEPEYVIYTFIDDHIRRLNLLIFDEWAAIGRNLLYLQYVDRGGVLVRNISLFRRIMFGSYFLKTFYMWAMDMNTENFLGIKDARRDELLDSLHLHFKTAAEMTQKKWPNAKFIILTYRNYSHFQSVQLARVWRALADENGVIVLDAGLLSGVDLSAKEFVADPHFHPNGKAWDVVVPPLVKELLRISADSFDRPCHFC